MIGIDVSNWQGFIAWDLVNATDIDFVYSLCSDGNFTGKVSGSPMSIQESYKRNKQLCKKPFGAYHFARPATTNPIITAEATAVANAGNQLPAMLDLEAIGIPETLSTADLIDWCKGWIEHYTFLDGRNPILYCGEDVRGAGLVAIFNKLLWWLPSYPTDIIDPDPSKLKVPKLPWDLWQYTNRGKVDGIRIAVDKTLTSSVVFQQMIGKANDMSAASFVGIEGEDGQYIVVPGGKVALSNPEERKLYVQSGTMADNTIWYSEPDMVQAIRALPTVTVATGPIPVDTKEVATQIVKAIVEDLAT